MPAGRPHFLQFSLRFDFMLHLCACLDIFPHKFVYCKQLFYLINHIQGFLKILRSFQMQLHHWTVACHEFPQAPFYYLPFFMVLLILLVFSSFYRAFIKTSIHLCICDNVIIRYESSIYERVTITTIRDVMLTTFIDFNSSMAFTMFFQSGVILRFIFFTDKKSQCGCRQLLMVLNRGWSHYWQVLGRWFGCYDLRGYDFWHHFLGFCQQRDVALYCLNVS